MPAATPAPPPPPSLLAPPLWRRMASWLYEGILLFGVVFVLGQVFSISMKMDHALKYHHLFQGFMFVMLGWYFAWFWVRGQTLAMKTWHIRVVDSTGQPVTFGRALLRYVLGWAWFLPPLAMLALVGNWKQFAALALLAAAMWVVVWALLSRLLPQRQFLHDVLAGTRLVHHAPAAPAGAHRKWWQL